MTGLRAGATNLPWLVLVKRKRDFRFGQCLPTAKVGGLHRAVANAAFYGLPALFGHGTCYPNNIGHNQALRNPQKPYGVSACKYRGFRGRYRQPPKPKRGYYVYVVTGMNQYEGK